MGIQPLDLLVIPKVAKVELVGYDERQEGDEDRNDLNVELLHGASELGQCWRGPAGRLIDPENAVFVTVECEWLAMPLKIRSGSLSVAEEALTLHKGQLSQPAGRIIDKDQYTTSRSTSFKPVMWRAIDLDQLPVTGAP